MRGQESTQWLLRLTEMMFAVFVGHRSEGFIFFVRFLILLPLLLLLFAQGVKAGM
jgi:hypothetical protein